MFAKALTCAGAGLGGAIVDVEADLTPGLPAFTIVGLPDADVPEAKEHVRAAIRKPGCQFPNRRPYRLLRLTQIKRYSGRPRRRSAR